MSQELLKNLSDADLEALATGSMEKVSDQGLRMLGGAQAPSKEWMAKVQAGMTLADKPWYTRAAIQLGAGVDDIVQGAKQLFTSDKPDGKGEPGISDTPYKRSQREVDSRRLLKKALAAQSDMGVAPDWVPTGGAALQFAGETLPWMAIPSAGAGSLVANGARGAVTGMVQGALQPVGTGESRTQNALISGALNAAAPVVGAVGNTARRMATKAGSAERAGEEVAGTLAENASKAESERILKQTLASLKGAKPGPVPLSTAASLGDAQLARLEAGSRARNGANWYDFDQNQARAVGDAFDRATAEASELGPRAATRSANWNQNWSQAQTLMGPTTWSKDLPAFRASLDVAKMSPDASNPAVRTMLDAITNEIDRLGDAFTPGHLQQIRANLSAKYNPMNPNAFAGAPRDSASRMNVMRDVDDILNKATGGQWSGVIQGYAQDSAAVRAAKAAGKVREAYIDPATGRVRGVAADAAGDVPKITEAGLGRAMDAARLPDRSLALSDDASTRLNEILAALRRQNIVQGVKRSATAGGGSNTASDTFAAKAAGGVADTLVSAVGAVPKFAWEAAKGVANAKRDQILAEALQDPMQMAKLIELQLKRGQPLTPQMEAFMRFISTAPAAAGTN